MSSALTRERRRKNLGERNNFRSMRILTERHSEAYQSGFVSVGFFRFWTKFIVFFSVSNRPLRLAPPPLLAYDVITALNYAMILDTCANTVSVQTH